MRKERTKRKISFKKLIGAVLVIALLVGSISAIVVFAKDETETVGSSKFSRGSIDLNTGLYVESEKAIYTENVIACNGLTITPDFESTSSYQIFWYNMDKKYVGYSRSYTPGETFAAADVPSVAWYCRIVITPSAVDENGNADKDFRIRFWEVNGYAKDLKIEVAKDQSASLHDIYENAATYTYEGDYDETGTLELLTEYDGAFLIDNAVVNDLGSSETLEIGSNEEYHVLVVDVQNISMLCIENEDNIVVHLYAYNETDGTITKVGYYTVSPGDTVVNEPEFSDTDFAAITVHGEPGRDINVYEYMPRTVGQIG